MKEYQLIKKVFEQYEFSKGIFCKYSACLKNGSLEVTENDNIDVLKEIIWGKAKKLVESGMVQIAFERGIRI